MAVVALPSTAGRDDGRALRILIVDDHLVTREGTRLFLERVGGWEVCGAASSGREALELLTQLQPDVLLLDLRLPDMDGFEVARRVRELSEPVEIVIFTGESTELALRQAYRSGAKAFVSKRAAGETLIAAIEAAGAHRMFVPPGMSEASIDRLVRDQAGGDTKRLTPREQEIVRRIAVGESNAAIARALGITVRTASAHRAAIMRKLHVSSAAEIVSYAVRVGIIEA